MAESEQDKADDGELQELPEEGFEYGASQIQSYDESLSQVRLKSIFNPANLPIFLIALVTFLNGLVGVAEPLFQRLSRHPKLFDFIVPYGAYHFSRALSLLFGFILIYLSFNLIARKRMSWILAFGGLLISLIIHVVRARMEYMHDDDFVADMLWFGVGPILLNLALLICYRKRFTVKSEIRKIKTGVSFLIYSLLVALAYGTLGFWILDKREFGINFQITDSLLRTLREFLLIGNSDIHAQTKHAEWFIDSLRTMGSISAVFACYSLFRPIEYQLRSRPLSAQWQRRFWTSMERMPWIITSYCPISRTSFRNQAIVL